MQRDQIAINSISTTQKDLPEAIEAYAAAGFRLVEFHIPLVKRWIEGRSVADARGLLERNGVRCIGGFETTVTCFGDDAAKRDNHTLHVENSRLLAALGGGREQTIVVGTDGPPQPDVEALKVIGRTLLELADRLDPSVGLAVEFNWSPVVKSLRSAAAVTEAADHPRVGILFDPAHYHCTSSKFEDLTPAVVRRVRHVHVDDMRDKPGELSNCNADRVLPGEGTLDLRRLLSRLEEHGYRGAFSIEMFNEELWKLPAVEAAKRCYEAMEKLCGE
jgi:sugar phosphate isomerase/epimerase